MFKPTNLDANRKYPIVNHIYPGPQGGSVGSWSFVAARGDTQALAELGSQTEHAPAQAATARTGVSLTPTAVQRSILSPQSNSR
jgi:hypothetical protein